MLQDDTFTSLGDAVGQRLTYSEIEALCDLLGHAAEGCRYAADDYDERADFERKHDGDEEDDFKDAANNFSDTADQVDSLILALKKGEEEHRDDGSYDTNDPDDMERLIRDVNDPKF